MSHFGRPPVRYNDRALACARVDELARSLRSQTAREAALDASRGEAAERESRMARRLRKAQRRAGKSKWELAVEEQQRANAALEQTFTRTVVDPLLRHSSAFWATYDAREHESQIRHGGAVPAVSLLRASSAGGGTSTASRDSSAVRTASSSSSVSVPLSATVLHVAPGDYSNFSSTTTAIAARQERREAHHLRLRAALEASSVLGQHRVVAQTEHATRRSDPRSPSRSTTRRVDFTLGPDVSQIPHEAEERSRPPPRAASAVLH